MTAAAWGDEEAIARNRTGESDELKTANEDLTKASGLLNVKNLSDKYPAMSYGSDFLGRSAANYAVGDIQQKEFLAWNNYLDNPTEAARNTAEALSELGAEVTAANEEGLKDHKLISGTLMSYLPQLKGQLQHAAAPAAAGLLMGGGAGAAVGYNAGQAHYGYEIMRGAAFKTLVEFGVDEETARKAATNEGVISSLIEFGGGLVELASMGTSAIGKAVFGSATKKLATKDLGKALGKYMSADKVKAVGKELAKFGINIGSERLEEGTQEAVSIANEQLAKAGETGRGALIATAADIFVDAHTNKNSPYRERVLSAEAEGGKIGGLMFGAGAVGIQGTGKLYSTVRENAAYAKAGRQIKGRDEAFDALLQSASQNEKFKDTAERIQQKVINGEDVSDREVGKLFTDFLVGEVSEERKAPVNVHITERTEEEKTARLATAKTETERSGIEAGASDMLIARAERIGKMLGVDIRFFNKAAHKDKNGSMVIENGSYKDGNIINLNVQTSNPIATVIAHEFTHYLEDTDSYGEMLTATKEFFKKSGLDYEELKQAKIDQYAAAGTTIDSNVAEYELMSVFAEEALFGSEQDIRNFITGHRTLGERMLGVIDSMLARFGNKDAQLRQDLQRIRNVYRKVLEESKTAEYQQKKAEARGGVDEKVKREAAKKDTENRSSITFADTKQTAIDELTAKVEFNNDPHVRALRDRIANGEMEEEDYDEELLNVMEEHPEVLRKYDTWTRLHNRHRARVAGDEEGVARAFTEKSTEPLMLALEARLNDITEKLDKMTERAETSDLQVRAANAELPAAESLPVANGIAFAPEVVEVMESDDYITPEKRYSITTEEPWARGFIKTFGDTEANKEIVQAIRDLDERTVLNDAIRGFVPMGKYNRSQRGPLRKNQDIYKFSFDLDTTCPRILQFRNYVTAIEKIAKRKMTEAEQVNLLELMRAYGQMIPCTYCYVETKRMALAGAYNLWFDTHHAVVTAKTDKAAITKMYGWDKKKKVLSKKSQQDTFERWRAEKDYDPTIEEIYHAYYTAQNSVFNLLDQMKEDGTLPKSKEAMNEKVCSIFNITDKDAKTEVESFVSDWYYDGQAGNGHVYTIDNDRSVSEVDQKALATHHEAIGYAKSSSSAHDVNNYVPYAGQLQKMLEWRDYFNSIGGVRKHSSNDFRIDYVQDYLLFYADLAAGGFMGHTYTKSTVFAKIFGWCGDRINMSIAMYGDDINHITENNQEGAVWAEVQELRKASPNVGAMAMVTNQAQLSYALNSDWIDMIIPFHASGLRTQVWFNMHFWQNFTSVQEERFYSSDDMKDILKERGISTKGMNAEEIADVYYQEFPCDVVYNYNEKEKTYSRVAPHFLPGAQTLYAKDENGKYYEVTVEGHNNDKEKYLQLCKQYGVRPRFDGVAVTDANGNEINVVEHPNYMKLVKETARTDTPQQAIEFNFNEPQEYLGGKTPLQYAFEQLQDQAEKGGFENLKEDQLAIVDEFVKEYLGKNRPYGYLTARATDYLAHRSGLSQQDIFDQFPQVARVARDIDIYDIGDEIIRPSEEFTQNWDTIQNRYGEMTPEQVEKLTGKQKDITRKSISSVQDAEYLRLAADPETNRDALQKMVDAAAKQAGYTQKGYHGTIEKFTVFDPKKSSRNNDVGAGIYVTNSEADAKGYAGLDGLNPDLKQDLDVYATDIADEAYDMETEYNDWVDVYNDAWDARMKEIESNGHVVRLFTRMIKPFTISEDEYISMDMVEQIVRSLPKEDAIYYDDYIYDFKRQADSDGRISTAALGGLNRLSSALKTLGYDGIIDKTVASRFDLKEGTEHQVLFYATSAKSADPVTYDDSGNVIPLSERFNPEKDDIRYSISPAQDQEYLRLAQDPIANKAVLQRMVDEAARAHGWRPKDLFHGSKDYGFTKFRLGKADDGRSIWLTDNKYVAESYSGTLKTGTPGGRGGEIVNGVRVADIATMPIQRVLDMYNELHEHDSRPLRILSPEELNNVINAEVRSIKKTADKATKILDDNKLLPYLYEVLDTPRETRSFVSQYLRWVASFSGANTAEEYRTLAARYDQLAPYPKGFFGIWSSIFGESDREVFANTLRFVAKNMELDPGATLVWNGDDFDIQYADRVRDQLAEDWEASADTDKGTRAGNYALYAKYDNPLVIEGEGNNWDEIFFIPPELRNLRRQIKQIEQRVGEANRGEDERWVALTKELGEQAEELNVLYELNVGGWNTTRAIVKYAQDRGYDSVIFEDIVDVSEDAWDYFASDVYVVFDPNQLKSADPVTYDDNGNVIPLSERFNTENDDIRYSRSTANQQTPYDFSKTFAEQIDDYKKGLFPSRDTLIVSGTPDVMRKIGMLPLPVTYPIGHLKDVLRGNVPNHDFSEANLKKLPDALADPIAIIDSVSPIARPNSLVVIVNLGTETTPVIAGVVVEGIGMMHGRQINSHAITTVHKRQNAANLLKNAINSQNRNGIGVYYIDKNKAAGLILNNAGVQFPGLRRIANGFIKSISDPGSLVNTQLNDITETKQFKRWFKGSKVLGTDGKPAIVYHATDDDFDIYLREYLGKNVAGNATDEYWEATAYVGFWFNTQNLQESLYTKRADACYLAIRHPLKLGSVEELTQLIREHSTSEDPKGMGEETLEWLQDEGYDGLKITDEELGGTSWVAFESTQIKSATDNIGTFDENNPNKRYSLSQIPDELENIAEGPRSPEEMISLAMPKEKQGVKAGIEKNWHTFQRLVVDAGETVHRISEALDDPSLYTYYNNVHAAQRRAEKMMELYAADVKGQRTGKSLNDIFDTIRERGNDYYRDFQLYLYHQHNIDLMSREDPEKAAAAKDAYNEFLDSYPAFQRMTQQEIDDIAWDKEHPLQTLAKEYNALASRWNYYKNLHNKPVFGVEVTAEESAKEVSRLEGEHVEFSRLAEEVYGYVRNLQKYRVSCGLISQMSVDHLNKLYPHYIPTYLLDEQGVTTGPQDAVTISSTVKEKNGNFKEVKLMPLHVALANQTRTVCRNGAMNLFGQRLLNDYYQLKGLEGLKKVSKVRGDIVRVSELYNSFNPEREETVNEIPDAINVTGAAKSNSFTVRVGDAAYEMVVSPELFTAIKALSPSENANERAVLSWLAKANNVFKALCTGYNPIFTAKNFIRDLQDVLFYSRDLSAFARNYPRAWSEIAKGGKYWETYQSLGGLWSSFYDYQTGELNKGNKLRRWTLGRIETLNEWVEQAPRLAEFMSAVDKVGGIEKATMDQLMDAMYAAADVTVNFGRKGTATWVNTYAIPFFNPAVQGFSKFVRRFTETKGPKKWANLICKAALFGIAPSLINQLLYADDDDWDELNDSDKNLCYCFKIGDGLWIKIPKGRALSIFGLFVNAGERVASGDEVDWWDYVKTGAEQVAPTNPFTSNIFYNVTTAHLLDRDNPGTTWYGSDIESQRLQNYEPSQRYDAKTDAISKWIGKQLGLSPKKINYIIDQYSGIIGDVVLPLLTPAAERNAFVKGFTIDSAQSNKLSNEFYELKDDLTYAKNSPNADETDELAVRWINNQAKGLAEINQAIRDIENDKKMSDKEKKDALHVQYNLRNELLRNALDTYGTWRNSMEDELRNAKTMITEDDIDTESLTPEDIQEKLTSLRQDHAFRAATKDVYGAEAALAMWDDAVYNKATEIKDVVSYDDFFEVYTDYSLRKYHDGGSPYMAIVDYGMSDAEATAMLSQIMPESQYERVSLGVGQGMSTTSYIRFQDIKKNFDYDGNNSYKQGEIEDALRSLMRGGGMQKMGFGSKTFSSGISETDAAILWQISNSGWKWYNNPFSQGISHKIYDALHADTATSFGGMQKMDFGGASSSGTMQKTDFNQTGNSSGGGMQKMSF